jgi:hypothetical protein
MAESEDLLAKYTRAGAQLRQFSKDLTQLSPGSPEHAVKLTQLVGVVGEVAVLADTMRTTDFTMLLGEVRDLERRIAALE